jgi:hypothetical protein
MPFRITIGNEFNTGVRESFPFWALARYRNLKRGNSRAAMFGM